MAGGEHPSVKEKGVDGLITFGVGLDNGVMDEGWRGEGEMVEDEVGIREGGGVGEGGDELAGSKGVGDGAGYEEVGMDLGGLGWG